MGTKNKKPDKDKIRKRWDIDPSTRVKKSSRQYSRTKLKREMLRQMEEEEEEENEH